MKPLLGVPFRVLLTLSAVTWAIEGQCALINGPWVVTNGNDSIDPVTANTNSPVLVPDNLVTPVVNSNTIQSAFPTITLTNPGDYVEASGSISLVRTANLATANRLNDQLRIGLFHAPAAPSTGVSGDPRGFIAEYGTGSPAGDIRSLIATQANPFSGGAATPVVATPAGADPEGHTLTGTPVVANFVLRLTRQAGNTVDITGNVSGVTVDPLDNDYLQAFSVLGHIPDASFNFTANRIAFLIGGNADASGGGLLNVQVTTNVPEPASWLLGSGLALAGATTRRRGGRRRR
jgi:hypothetical protein